jgi:hypothetical protein
MERYCKYCGKPDCIGECENERKKRFDDHWAYTWLCEQLWIPDHKRCAVFGVGDFYEHAKKIIQTEEYQYRIQVLKSMVKLINEVEAIKNTTDETNGN